MNVDGWGERVDERGFCPFILPYSTLLVLSDGELKIIDSRMVTAVDDRWSYYQPSTISQ